MLIKCIHAKFYANAIAIYNASKMNTHEFNKLLGFEAGAHSPFHTPTCSATWYVIQFRARTAILAEITTTVKTALQKANNKKQGQEPVTIKETKKAIKILKRKKSQGSDDIPNEIFQEANRETTKTLTKMINNVHEEESIPKSWLEGNIIRLYKGKGQKGKCSNERGITLASNVGKVYERVINERVKEVTQITDAQAGGKAVPQQTAL